MHFSRIYQLLVALATLALPHIIAAQDFDEEYEAEVLPSSSNVAIAIRAGAVISTPRGTFPSLIIGDSRFPTGPIAQSYGASAAGTQVDLAFLIPFNPRLGLSSSFGTQVIVARHDRDSLGFGSKFSWQILYGAVGVQWSFVHMEESYRRGGLRSVYVAGGVDVMLVGIANRLESIGWADTLSGPRASTGSFESGEPFRNLVGLHGGLGLRFAATPSIELLAEASYSWAVNAVFSSDAVENNDFTVDRFSVLAGVGYRF